MGFRSCWCGAAAQELPQPLKQASFRQQRGLHLPRFSGGLGGLMFEKHAPRSWRRCVPAVVGISQVRRLHAFVKDRHPNAVCLETVVVSRALVKQLEAVADGAVAEASWFEVMLGVLADTIRCCLV